MANKAPSATRKLKPKSSNPPSLRVLIVEDSEDDALLIIRELKKGGYNPVYERVETAAAMLSALQDKTWDIVLSDYKMPHFSGTAAIALLKETNIDIPLILVSGSIGEEMAVECMRLGAHDYIMKDSLPRLCPAIARELEEAKSRAERKLAEQAVINSEVRFRELFENISSCVAVYEAIADGTDFVFKDFNRAAEIAEKIDAKMIIGQSLLQVFPGVREMGLLEMLQRVWRTGQSEHVPAAYYKDARNEGWRENYVYKLPTGEVVALYNDITQRKKAEIKILESEGKYRLLVENGSEGIFIAQGEILKFVNKAFVKEVGSSNEVMTSTPFRKFVYPEDWEMVRANYLRRLKGEATPDVYAFRIVASDGTIKWVEIHATVISWQGEPATLNFITDITERRQVEETLKESENKYRLLADNITDVIFVLDMNLNYIYISPSVKSLRGYEPAEVLKQSASESLTPASLDLAMRALSEGLELKKAGSGEIPLSKTLQLEMRRKDGTSVWTEVKISFINDENQQPVSLLGVSRDITERKLAEEALQKSQKQLQDAYSLAEIGSWSWNASDKTTTWSKELCRIVGLNSQQLDFHDTKHPPIYTRESWDLVKKAINDSLKTGKPCEVEAEIVRLDGSTGWVNWVGGAIYNDRGKITGMNGTAQNITQRKIAESQREMALKALRESEEKYRWVLDNMADVIAVMDMDLRFTYVSPAIMRMRGYTAEEAKAQTMEQVMTPESLKISAKVFEEEMKLEATGTADPGRSRILEVQEYKKDGSIIWMENHLSFLRDETKKAVGIISLTRDITVLKRAEEELKQSEKRYRSIFQNAQEGIYRSTPEGRVTMANPAMAKLFGYATPEELINGVTDIAGQLYVKPGERTKMLGICAKQGSQINYETQFYRKDRSIIWVSMTMRGIHDEEGHILYYEGLIEDITNRKESAERMRKTLGATVQAIAVTVETRDPYTAGHQRRVSDLARAIATEMNLPADQIEGIRMAAAIHDLGKISIPAEILSKPTKLTNIEFSLIKTHSQSGYDILKDIDFPWPVAMVVLEHHERMDGSGYPNGLTGDNILLESRILAVADVVESMSSHRPYRPTLGIKAALEEIEKNKGTCYDNTVVAACLRLFREKGFQLARV